MAVVAPQLSGGQTLPAVPAPTAASDNLLVLRAVYPNLPKNIVDLVADSAEPTRFNAQRNPDLRARSARDIAEQLCGSPTSDYFDAWRRINDHRADALDLDAPIGENAYRLVWPACLYANNSKGKYVVAQGDTVPGLYEILTGSAGSKQSWSSFFAGSRLSASNDLTIGQVLTFGWNTRPVTLRLTIPKSAFEKAFADRLAEAQNGDPRKLPAKPVASRTQTVRIPISAGKLLSSTSGRVTYGEAPGCAGIDTAPFDPARVATTYRFAREQAGFSTQTALLVIDNGFFGAHAVDGAAVFGASFADAAPLFLSRFPEGIIGPVLKPGLNEALYPLNGDNQVTIVDERSGHGTHVVGLALGGPGFDRTLLKGWGTVAVAAVAKGQDQFDGLAASDIATAVNDTQPRIVNMSLEYSKDRLGDLTELATKHPNVLFIVAAGNDGQTVEESAGYPAMLAGGPDTQNILVVAATAGASTTLAPFSNYSETKVGIAAPGCRLRSWLGEDGATTPLSGTSQATPLVSFEAMLLSSIMPTVTTPEALIYRIQVSGDPLDPDTQTQVPTRANIEHALFVHFDYINYQPSNSPADLAAAPIELLGELETVPTWKPCVGIPADQIWSFAGKPTPTGQSAVSIITGYQDGKMSRPVPCRRVGLDAGKGRVRFKALWRITSTGVLEQASAAEKEAHDVDVALINRFIRKGPGAIIR